MIENIEQAKGKLKSIVDFYKLNDENNYDYSDRVLISMKLVLEEIERLNNIIKGLDNTIENLEEVIKHKDSIIKEVREYIEHKASIRECYMINGKEYKELLEILKGSDKK